MVRKKINHTLSIGSIAIAAAVLSSILITPASLVFADDTTVSVKAEEMLTVQVTTQDDNATGDPGDFLRDMVTLTVATNNDTGFTATMTASSSTTALTNQTDSSFTIPTLSANSARSAVSDAWGFSLDDTAVGNDSSTYQPVVALGSSTPSHIMNVASNSTYTSKDIYFGTRTTAAKASGTYSNTVVFNVVSGINTSDPTDPGVTPTDPVTPGDDPTPTDNTPTYVPGNAGGSATGATVYTRTSTSGDGTTTPRTTTTGTTVTRGNTTTSTYVSPAGVTNTAVNEGTPLATGLAVTAGVAATAGIIFFIVAKRRRDDDEEEDQMQQ